MGSLEVDQLNWLDGSVALIVKGVVDDDTVEQFERTLDSTVGAGSRQLVLDLTNCRLASAGLAAMVRFQRRSRSHRPAARLVVAGVDPLRMLQIVGLTSRFRIFATLDAAHQSSSSTTPPVAWPRRAAVREGRHLTSVASCGRSLESGYGGRQ